MSKENTPDINKKSFSDKLIDNRAIKSLIAGIVITVTSLVIVGFNLSTNSGIQINDSVNRYFSTCVGQAFISSTPRITVVERGFPLSYLQTSHVPVCENTGVQIKQESTRSFELGAFFANVLFWSCVIFVLARTYVRRKHIKITRSA